MVILIYDVLPSQLKDKARKEDVKTMLVKSPGIRTAPEASEITLTESDLPHTKLEDFNLLLVLGKGSFGKVCVVWCAVYCSMCVYCGVCMCVCVCVYCVVKHV